MKAKDLLDSLRGAAEDDELSFDVHGRFWHFRGATVEGGRVVVVLEPAGGEPDAPQAPPAGPGQPQTVTAGAEGWVVDQGVMSQPPPDAGIV